MTMIQHHHQGEKKKGKSCRGSFVNSQCGRQFFFLNGADFGYQLLPLAGEGLLARGTKFN